MFLYMLKLRLHIFTGISLDSQILFLDKHMIQISLDIDSILCI